MTLTLEASAASDAAIAATRFAVLVSNLIGGIVPHRRLDETRCLASRWARNYNRPLAWRPQGQAAPSSTAHRAPKSINPCHMAPLAAFAAILTTPLHVIWTWTQHVISSTPASRCLAR